MLLLPDSNYITWVPSIPCCLLPSPPVSKLGNLHTFPSETKELENVHSQRRVPTTLAFFNGVSEAWSLCARFHMKPRGSFTATVLTEGQTLPERSTDTSIFYVILPSERSDFFSNTNVFEKVTFH